MASNKRDFIAENIRKYSEQPDEPKMKGKMVKKKTTTACKGETAGPSARDSKDALEGTSGKSDTLRRSPRIKGSAQLKSKEPKMKGKMVKKKTTTACKGETAGPSARDSKDALEGTSGKSDTLRRSPRIKGSAQLKSKEPKMKGKMVKKKTTTACKGETAGPSARDSKDALEGTSGKSDTLRRSPRIKGSAQLKSKIPVALPRKRPAGNTMKGSGQPTPPKVRRLAAESAQVQEEGQREEGASAPNPGEEGASAPNPDEEGAPDPMLERRIRWASTPPRLSIIYEEEDISQKRSSDEQSSSHEMQAPCAVEEDPESRD